MNRFFFTIAFDTCLGFEKNILLDVINLNFTFYLYIYRLYWIKYIIFCVISYKISQYITKNDVPNRCYLVSCDENSLLIDFLFYFI